MKVYDAAASGTLLVYITLVISFSLQIHAKHRFPNFKKFCTHNYNNIFKKGQTIQLREIFLKHFVSSATAKSYLIDLLMSLQHYLQGTYTEKKIVSNTKHL